MAIALFNKIEGGVAIVRKPKGYLVQAELYSRGHQVYIKTGAGFIRIAENVGDCYLTVNPDYKVLELEAAGVMLLPNKAPSFALPAPIKSVGWGNPLPPPIEARNYSK